MKPRLLDLFCGAGGAAMGYARAGFEVVGVDIAPQPNYPFTFLQADALAVLEGMLNLRRAGWPPTAFLGRVDAIHASPPCQAFSPLRKLHPGRDYPELIEPVRELLEATGLPYVIENVPGSPLRSPTTLCGSSFGLDVRRHRLFETNWPLLGPPCAHGVHTPRFANTGTRRRAVLSSVVGVYGGSHFKGDNKAYRVAAMGGGDWMTMDELSQSIPSCFTELIGAQLLDHIRARTAA